MSDVDVRAVRFPMDRGELLSRRLAFVELVPLLYREKKHFVEHFVEHFIPARL
jgi:hypothetical protein